MTININPATPTTPKAKQPTAPQAEKPEAAASMTQDAFVSTATPERVTVKAGDTLAKIAKRYKISLGELLTLNPQLTAGKNRRMDGSRIYVGDVVRLKAEKPPEPPKPDPRIGELEGKLKEHQDKLKEQQDKLSEQQAKAEIQQAKFSISRMPKPEAWRSEEDVVKAFEKAEANLAKVPESDPDFASLKDQIDGARNAWEGMKAENKRLAGEPEKVGQTKDDIQALSATAVALATPAEKAGMIRNLVRRDNADASAEKKILEILRDAQRQGQFDTVMDTLHGMDRKVLFIKDKSFMDYMLPRVMSDKNLNALEQLATVSKREDLIKACQTERQERAERAAGYGH